MALVNTLHADFQQRDPQSPANEKVFRRTAVGPAGVTLRQALGLKWLHPAGIHSTSRLLAMMDLQPWMRVLDVGTGLGATARYIAETYGCEVVGLDRDPHMIDEAHRLTGPEFRRVHFVGEDYLNMPMESGAFDAIVMESLLWANEKPAFLARAFRLLKPWGQLGINESTWLRTPSEHARDIGRLALSESFSDTLPEHAWLSLIEHSGFYNIEHEVRPLQSLSLHQIYQEEGLFGMLRTMSRIRQTPEIRSRLEEIKTLFQTYPDTFGYGVYLAWKPGD